MEDKNAEQLEKLESLLADGALTPEEFDSLKSLLEKEKNNDNQDLRLAIKLTGFLSMVGIFGVVVSILYSMIGYWEEVFVLGENSAGHQKDFLIEAMLIRAISFAVFVIFEFLNKCLKKFKDA